MLRPYPSYLHEYIAEMKPELGAQGVRQLLKAGHMLPAILSRQEVLRCILAGGSVRNCLIIRVFYATGVRIEEMQNFVVADIRWDDSLMFVREGKGGQDRLVCVDRNTLGLLRQYTQHMAASASLFGIRITQLRRIVEDAGQTLGLVERYAAMGRRFSPHAFRHSYATHCFENGMDLLSLKKLLGHHHLGTTELYVAVSMQSVAKAYTQSHPLNQLEPDGAVTALRLNRSATEDPDLRHLIQSYRSCHELALGADKVT